MKFSTIACALTLCLSTAASSAATAPSQYEPSVDVQPGISTTANLVDPVTMSVVGSWIIKGAKSAIIGQVKSFLKDALFGAGGPNYVMLNEQSLQQIEDIVTEVVLTSDVENAKSQLMSFRDLMEYYNASAQDDVPDYTVLPTLINYATSLKNHQAYRDTYNPNAFMLTASYSLVASLTIAVFAEKELQGEIDHAYVKSVANSLYTSLTYLGSKANSYIYSKVYVESPDKNCSSLNVSGQMQDKPAAKKRALDQDIDFDAIVSSGPGISREQGRQAPQTNLMSECTYKVYDLIAGAAKLYPVPLYGESQARSLAYQQENTWISKYQGLFKGSEYSTIASELHSY